MDKVGCRNRIASSSREGSLTALAKATCEVLAGHWWGAAGAALWLLTDCSQCGLTGNGLLRSGRY